MTAIWWIRRDLRLHDNPALTEALEHGNVIPVFVLDPVLLEGRYHRLAGRRQAFLFAGLKALDSSLRERGSRLIVRTGRPTAVLPGLAKHAGATAVFAAADHSPYSKRRDASVSDTLPLTLVDGIAIQHPAGITKDDGTPFRVFTPFSRAWLRTPPLRRDILETPAVLPSIPSTLASETSPDVEPPTGFPAGESEALRRLDTFMHGRDAIIASYATGRDRLDFDSTSALSPYLRFGMLSPRLAAVTALERLQAAATETERKGAAAWLNELIWRDFYIAVLHHFPGVLRQEFDATFRDMPWLNRPEDIAAWQTGQTGFPVVDAAMRQLAATGWMHNRARMIVASFLVKHLLVDWRIGEAWFIHQLIDGDPAANNGGWQWTAGVGTDAAPYFRVFNPVLQSKRFDPEGDFIRRWLPELASVPSRYIHEPWRMPARLQDELAVRIGTDYPAPIVDLAEGRDRALSAYKQAREATRS